MSNSTKTQNNFLSDYAYLAEVSYTDFSKAENAYEDIKDTNNGNKPESFATLVTNNYSVIAHYKDRTNGNENSFSGILFKGI